MNVKFWIFLVVFVAMNFVFVPLLSIYGLRVCPVLSIAGFWFGCAYAGTFIFLVGLLNMTMILGLPKLLKNQVFKNHSFLFYVGSYVFATVAALIVLQIMLNLNHLSGTSRAPEILAFASILLGITQAYGMNWAQLGKIDFHLTPQKQFGFRKLWVLHSLRTLLPIVMSLGVMIHFQVSQSIGFNHGATAEVVGHDKMIYHTILVVAFLMIWLLVTFTFHFLAEGTYAFAMQLHLKKLKELETEFRSPVSGNRGFWTELLAQLNDFSKALSERSRLLKSFSKFVSTGVAEQALKIDLKQTTGTTKDSTILMSDIRNFTSLSERLEAHQVVSLLNQYFTAMLEIMVQNQVNVDKFIGDGILAYVETTERNDGNADEENKLAVNAALAMQARLAELNVLFESQNLPAIEIGIGIHRGPVVVGLIGSDTKLQHTIIGDSVNRTARLEGLCKDLQVSIVISEEVWTSVSKDGSLGFRSFGKQSVKGIKDPIGVYGFPR